MAKNDCDVLLDGAKDVFGNLENCFDSAFDDKKTKINVIGSIFGLGKSLTKLTFNAGCCIVKNTPKAVVAVASAKRELINAVEEEMREYDKQKKEEALDMKIKLLKQNR